VSTKYVLKKQSQFVPGLIGATSYLKGNYDKHPIWEARKNKANRRPPAGNLCLRYSKHQTLNPKQFERVNLKKQTQFWKRQNECKACYNKELQQINTIGLLVKTNRIYSIVSIWCLFAFIRGQGYLKKQSQSVRNRLPDRFIIVQRAACCVSGFEKTKPIYSFGVLRKRSTQHEFRSCY
jgi:hypothetical protein